MHIASESQTPPPLPKTKGNTALGYIIFLVVIAVSAWSYELLNSAGELLKKLAPGEVTIITAISFAGVFKLTPIAIIILSKALKLVKVVKKDSVRAGRIVALGFFLSISCSLLLDSCLINAAMKATRHANEKNSGIEIYKSYQVTEKYAATAGEMTTTNTWAISTNEAHSKNPFRVTYIRTVKGGMPVMKKIDINHKCSVTTQEHSDAKGHVINFMIDGKTIDSIDAPSISIPLDYDNNDNGSSVNVLTVNYSSKADTGMIIITAGAIPLHAEHKPNPSASNHSLE